MAIPYTEVIIFPVLYASTAVIIVGPAMELLSDRTLEPTANLSEDGGHGGHEKLNETSGGVAGRRANGKVDKGRSGRGWGAELARGPWMTSQWN